MRVTQNTMFNQLSRQLQGNTARLIQAQERMATQKRINRLSDNPIDGGRVIDLKGAVARSDQYLNNIERLTSVAGVYDTASGQLHDLLARSKELLVKESNEVTSTAATREATRIELSILSNQLVSIANTQFDGKYVFGGYRTDQPPFAEAAATLGGAALADGTLHGSARVLDATAMNYHAHEIRFTAADRFDIIDTDTGQPVSTNQPYQSGQPIRFGGIELTVANGAGAPTAGMTLQLTSTPAGAYQGDSQLQEIEIQPGSRVPLNIPGDRIFQGVGRPGGIDLFALMNTIDTALREGDTTAIQAQLDRLDQAREQVSSERAGVGTRVNLLEQVKSRQTDIKSNLEILRSNIEDIDIAEALTELSKSQNAYEASLSAGSRIVQSSLLDFLR